MAAESDLIIRDAVGFEPGTTTPSSDARDCARIYAPYVTDTTISFETAAPDERELARRIAAVRATHAWIVAEVDGAIAGYAYGTIFNEREAYRWSTIVSVYLEPDTTSRGLGTALYRELLDRLTGLGYRQAFGGVVLPNDPSVALHRKLGFELCGVHRDVGFKLGRWLDVAWYQRRLGPGSDSAPDSTTPQTAPESAPGR